MEWTDYCMIGIICSAIWLFIALRSASRVDEFGQPIQSKKFIFKNKSKKNGS